MALFPQTFVDDLKAQTNIVSVIERGHALAQDGRDVQGPCPFHQEKTPSFNVNPDKGFFKCFGCGVGGDVVKFVELHHKVTLPRSGPHARRASRHADSRGRRRSRRPAARAEREAIVKLHERALAFFEEQLASAAGARARRELDARALPATTIKTFRYGYAPAGGRITLRSLFADAKGARRPSN